MSNEAFLLEEETGPEIIIEPPRSRLRVTRPRLSTGGGGFILPPSGETPILTKAGHNAAENAEVLVKNTNRGDWVNRKWRPMMGWVYMVTCVFDFIIAPILWSMIQAYAHGQVETQWQPLTLQGAGLYHVAMGAVLGIAAYGRTREKINGLTESDDNPPKEKKTA